MVSKEQAAQILSLSSEFNYDISPTLKSLEEFDEVGEKWIKLAGEQFPELLYAAEEIVLYAKNLFRGSQRLNILNTSEEVLIMKGGGIKGLAYVGALEALGDTYKFNWFAGTSAGAITAVLLSAGYTIKELKTILYDKDFKSFKDACYLKIPVNLWKHKGMYRGFSFEVWLNKLLSKKIDTALQVKLHHLPKRATIYACTRDEPLIFDSTIIQNGGTGAAFAARCSMSIPYIFMPQMNQGVHVFDGGLKNNFPVELLLQHNPNANFLGLYLGDEHFVKKKNNVFLDVFRVFLESTEPNILEKYEKQIIVIDPSPISTLKFRLNEVEKNFLLEAGRLAAIKFLSKRGLTDLEGHNYESRKTALEKIRHTLKRKKKIRKFWFWTKIVLAVAGLIYCVTLWKILAWVCISLASLL